MNTLEEFTVQWRKDSYNRDTDEELQLRLLLVSPWIYLREMKLTGLEVKIKLRTNKSSDKRKTNTIC